MEDLINRLRRQLLAIEADGSFNMKSGHIRAAHDEISNILDEIDLLGKADDLLSPRNIELRRRFIATNAKLHSRTELIMAESLLRSAGDVMSFLEKTYINKGFSDLLRLQIDEWRKCGVRLCESDRIILVGGGALPQTQVFLSKCVPCKIVCVDRDLQAVELCQKILRKNGNKDLTAVHADGANFDYAGASLVVVATLVEDKEKIAVRIKDTNSKAFFSPRCPVGAHAFWRSKIDWEFMTSIGWNLISVLSPRSSSVKSALFAR